MLWLAAAGAAGTLLLLILWEAVLGDGGATAARIGGYLAMGVAAGAAGVALVRSWRAPRPAARTIADRLEQLFPQARGRARDVLAETEPGGGLQAARVASARGWIAARGAARLDGALVTSDRDAATRARWLAAGSLVLLLLVAGVDPGAARRAAASLSSPASLWGTEAWRVEPGDTRVAYGDAIEGWARVRGGTPGSPIVLDWIETGRAWRAETLAAASVATWRWERLTRARLYRLRRGGSTSRTYRIEVGPPLALQRLEARQPGGAWQPLAGRVVRAGTTLEIQGWASGPLAAAEVVPDGGGAGFELSVEGDRLTGAVRLTAGAWRLALRAVDGTELRAAPFRAVPIGEAYVVVLRPAEDPARLGATSVWLEARVVAPGGIRAVAWEVAGRVLGGSLGDPRGARDTVLAEVAPIAKGLRAGDSVRYRVVAYPVTGLPVAGAWRTGIMAGAAELREEAGAARAEAIRAVEQAADQAREAADRSPGEATAAEDRLRAAADSLARAIDRTLGDPDLPPETRERLESYRAILAGVGDAELARPEVLGTVPPDPGGAARARADLLREIAAAVQRAEELAETMAAADSLGRLADAELALAEDTRTVDRERLAAEIGDRQEAIAHAARTTVERLPADAAARVERALEDVTGEIASADPAAAADAQEGAAAAMDAAAAAARAESEADAKRAAARRAAVDRAAGETLFLAERQRAVAERLTAPAADVGEQGDRLARQRVVVQGLDRTLAALIETMGGLPASAQTARLLAESVYATRRAESLLTSGLGSGPVGERRARAAADEAAGSLALLARAFLLPPGTFGMGGAQGSAAESGSLARQLDAMASAQRSIADAAARADDPAAGNPEAAAVERQLGRELGGLGERLEAQGVDARAVGALVEAVESAARQLERGLPGARTETELRSLARRFADLGRIVQRREGERRAEAARAFVPAVPPPLPGRATARRLDPEAALAPWKESLPRPALAPARAYLERLADQGVRAPGGEP